MFRLAAFFIPFYFMIFASDNHASRHGLTYGFSGGRFGDNILSYYQARYLSFISGVPFIYKPFPLSDQLSIDYDAKLYDEEITRFENFIEIKNYEDLKDYFNHINEKGSKRTLFTLSYLCTDISEWGSGPSKEKILFKFDDVDERFKKLIRKCIAPKIDIINLSKKNLLNVAVHVRTLSGTDTKETSWKQLPLKHVSIEYHINQIKKIYELNRKKDLHVFIFTDSEEPLLVLDSIKSRFNQKNIIFSIKEKANNDANSVIQDFFGMQKFDALIATQSNFSMMSARVGNFELIIFPVRLLGDYPNFFVDRVQILSRGGKHFPYKFNTIVGE